MTVPEPVGANSQIPGDGRSPAGAHPAKTRRPARKMPWRRSRVLRRLSRNKAAMASLVMLVILVLIAIFADLIAPHDPNKVALTLRLTGPSPAHWLGTDDLGRDVLSRLIVAT